ncbi:MAG: glycosyltransferase family 39 protein [Acidobacteriota bacterium]
MAAWLLAGWLVHLAGALVFPHPAPDTARYMEEARSLWEEGSFAIHGRPTAFDGPLYALLLAPFHGLARMLGGAEALSIWLRLPGILLGGAVPVLVLLVIRETGLSRFAAFGGATLALVNPLLIGASGFVLTESAQAAFLSLAVWRTVRAFRAGGTWRWLGAGAGWGAAALCRPTPLLFLPLLAMLGGPVWNRRGVAAGGKGRAAGWLRCAGLFLGGAAAVTAPWMVRNAVQFGAWIPVSLRGGQVLWAGTVSGGQWDDATMLRLRTELVGPDFRLRELETERILLAEALKTIRRQPLKWIAAMPAKAARLWLGLPGAVFVLREHPLLARGVRLYEAVLAAGALASIALLWPGLRRPGRCVLLAIPLAYLFYETGLYMVLLALPRFRIPLLPLRAMIMAPLLDAAWRRRGRHRVQAAPPRGTAPVPG